MIRLEMTDLDIIVRARDIMAPGKKIGIKQRTGKKDIYHFSCYGPSAIQWMLTVYSLIRH
jgi:hypothetical protein